MGRRAWLGGKEGGEGVVRREGREVEQKVKCVNAATHITTSIHELVAGNKSTTLIEFSRASEYGASYADTTQVTLMPAESKKMRPRTDISGLEGVEWKVRRREVLCVVGRPFLAVVTYSVTVTCELGQQAMAVTTTSLQHSPSC